MTYYSYLRGLLICYSGGLKALADDAGISAQTIHTLCNYASVKPPWRIARAITEACKSAGFKTPQGEDITETMIVDAWKTKRTI